MQRRKFLGLFGSAVAAPMMPLPAMAQAGYSQTAWNTAVATARGSAAVSVNGMARALGLSPAMAETLMRDMVGKGMLSPLSGTRHGGVWAASKLMKPINIAAAQKAQQVARNQAASDRSDAKAQAKPSDWISHLQKICVNNGMDLQPRCFA